MTIMTGVGTEGLSTGPATGLLRVVIGLGLPIVHVHGDAYHTKQHNTNDRMCLSMLCIIMHEYVYMNA